MKSSEGLGNPINKWFNLGIINVIVIILQTNENE